MWKPETDWASLEELDNELERLAAKAGRQILFANEHPDRRDEFRPSIARLKDEIILNRALYEAMQVEGRQ